MCMSIYGAKEQPRSNHGGAAKPYTYKEEPPISLRGQAATMTRNLITVNGCAVDIFGSLVSQSPTPKSLRFVGTDTQANVLWRIPKFIIFVAQTSMAQFGRVEYWVRTCHRSHTRFLYINDRTFLTHCKIPPHRMSATRRAQTSE